MVHGAPNRVEDVVHADYRPSRYFPVARGLGATEFCIRDNDGRVVYLAYDGTTDTPVVVAESFSAFIEAIIVDDDDDDWL